MREVAVGSTPAAGQARRQGAAVSHSLFGFILGPLQLEDARVSPIRDLGQNQQVVAPEARASSSTARRRRGRSGS